MFNLHSLCFLLIFLVLGGHHLSGQAPSASPDTLSKKEQRREARRLRLAATDRYFLIGALGSFHRVQDQGLSQQAYQGWGGGLRLSGLELRGPHQHEFRVQGAFSWLDSPAYIRTQDIWSQFSYTYLHQLPTKQQANWWLGPQADILSQVRVTEALNNSRLRWDVQGALGFALRFQTPVFPQWLGPGWQAYGQIYVPLLSYLIRPGYNINSPNEHGLRVVGRLQRIEFDWGLQLPVRKGNPNAYRVHYQWSLFRWRDNSVHRLITARHSIGFSILFNTL